MSGRGTESGNVTLTEMVGVTRSRYTRDGSWKHSSRDVGGDGDRGIGGIHRVGYGRMEGGKMK